jgi:tetratricopeptide (TPR) repeat protein
LKPVRAFVGHSFTPDDAALVDSFLKYLSAISEMHPSFSWQHAERAEPRVIDEKVLELFSDKTLFIAICTRKERVISSSALDRAFLRPRRLVADEAAFDWKTSDWIIQEIGLAIGLGLPVVLLVEDGVRSPGGLQGNLEYIVFTRDAPEKAFPKLLEMIGTLSPRTDALQEAERPGEPPLDGAWTNPSPAWSRRNYDFAFMHFVAMADEPSAKSISDSFLASDLGGSEESRKSWAAYCEWVRIVFDKGGKLQRLVSLAKENSAIADVVENLASAFLHYEEYSKAADTFERAAGTAKDPQDVTRLLKKAALAAQKAGDGARALSSVDRMRQIAAAAGVGQENILEAERVLGELRKEDDVQLAALERLLEISPEDAEKRFAIAYKYSEMERDDLAAQHYSRIPPAERTGVVWNNLAVSLDRLELPGKSVSAYRRAEGLGETLAMSNLSNKLMGAGFVTEARAVCEAAIAIKDHHKNVDASLSRLKELPEEENKKESEVLERARPISDFYREFGAGLTRPLPSELAHQWRGPDCALAIRLEAGKLTARGTYERAQGGLIAAMMSIEGFTGRPDAAPLRFQVEYVATARGSALMGKVERIREGEVLEKATSTLLTQEAGSTVMMVVSIDGKSIRVLERSKNSNPRVYTFSAT